MNVRVGLYFEVLIQVVFVYPIFSFVFSHNYNLLTLHHSGAGMGEGGGNPPDFLSAFLQSLPNPWDQGRTQEQMKSHSKKPGDKIKKKGLLALGTRDWGRKKQTERKLGPE